MEFLYGNQQKYLIFHQSGQICMQEGGKKTKLNEAYRVTSEDIAEMLNYISNYSLYAYQEEMKQGYITVEGGHRIGVAGQATVRDGRLVGICYVTFLNIRVAHEKIGCAEKIVPLLQNGETIYNTLILSPPGAGKTTLLRDCIRLLSLGRNDRAGCKISVVDERSEIAACYHGIPQNDLGPRTDVLDGCSKADGILMLIRSMSPQIVAVDELGTERDFLAVEQAVYAGSKVLGTIHAGEIGELSEKPYLKRWMKKEIFKRLILIEKGENGSRDYKIYNGRLEQLC